MAMVGRAIQYSLIRKMSRDSPIFSSVSSSCFSEVKNSSVSSGSSFSGWSDVISGKSGCFLWWEFCGEFGFWVLFDRRRRQGGRRVRNLLSLCQGRRHDRGRGCLLVLKVV